MSPSSPSTEPRTLRIGVIGCGAMGRRHAVAVCESPIAELVGVCDLAEDRAASLAAETRSASFTNHLHLLERLTPDIVTIATPDHMHAQAAIDAMRRGCHVFCEKPLATDLASAQNMVQAARTAGVHLAVNYNRRFGFGYELAKQKADQGEIGTIENCVLTVTDRTPPATVAIASEAMLTTLLSHHIDLLRWYCGEARTVTATFSEISSANLVRHMNLAFRFENGAIGSIVASYRDHQARTAERLQLIGSLGVIAIDDVTRGLECWKGDPDNVLRSVPSPFSNEHDFWHTTTKHVHDFIHRVANGLQPLVSGEDGLQGLCIIAAAIRSQQTAATQEI